MSDTDINATINVTEDVFADVDSTAMSAAVIDDGDSIVVPAEVDFGHTLDTELMEGDLIDVPVDESVGIEGDHRVLLHRDASNQHPMSAITGLEDALDDIDTALSSRIGQVEAENAELEVDMATAFLRIGDLQNQVDGNITTWFYAAVPAMNLPPVTVDPLNPYDTGWDTDEKKNKHKGDLYYNTLTGYAYRFAYVSGEYSWMRITDTDVVKALADAAHAQDTADSKRRVFYATPTPPYDKGDLWVQGSSGDILVCTTDKPADGAYALADWSLASKYTDDTVADLALASANGKNTIYHQASQPIGGTYKAGDTWFDTDDDFTMYTYDGALWVKEQFGNEAIADASITNAKIANATIEYGKIKSVDAGKITVGDLAADRIKASVITAVNNSTETSGGSDLLISASKVNIQGAAIFQSGGYLNQDSLDAAYDANGAAAAVAATVPTDVSDLTDSSGVIPTDVSDLSDSSGVIPTDVSDLSDSSGVIPTDVSDLSDTSGKIPTDVSDLSDTSGMIPTDVSDLSDSSGVIPTDVSDLSDTSGKIPTDVSDLTDTGGVIPTDVSDLSDTGGVIPTDVSNLTDTNGVIPTDVSDLTDTGGVIPTDVSDLTDTGGVIPTDVSDLTDTQGVIPDVSGKADKTDAVAEEQLIYKQAVSGTNSMSGTTTWVTATGESVSADTAGLTPVWTTKRPTYRSNYPVLFVAKQKKMVSGTITCSTPLKDDTTTIIDGGHITTGTIDAARLNINAIIVSGSIATTSDIPTDISDLSDSSGVIPTDVSDLSDTSGKIPSDVSDLTDSSGVIPTDVSDLSDSSGVIPTDVSDLSDTGGVIPTDVSNLTDTNGVIPTDVSDLSDTGGVIPTDVSDLSDTGGVIPTDVSDLTDSGGVIPADVSDLTDTNGVITGAVGKYITAIDSSGIKVHAENNVNSNYAKIDSSGMEVYKGGNSVAVYGDTARVGKSATRHIEIGNGGLQVYSDTSTVMAHLGYGEGRTENGTAQNPYYTLGKRLSSAPTYSSSNTYLQGQVCEHNGTLYVCQEDINPPEAWNASHWITPIIGNYSLAEGVDNVAVAKSSHAEGEDTVAMGWCSHAEGSFTIASGINSHAQNEGTLAVYTNQTAIGSYNACNDTAFEIGNGSSEISRSNAFEVDWDGNVNIASGATYKINGTSIVSGVKGDAENSYRRNNVNLTSANIGAVALADKYTRSSAGDLAWTNQTDGDAKVIAKSALAFWNGAYAGSGSNLSKCSTGNIVGTNGATMTGQLKTSFKTSVAMGSYGSSQTTIPDFVNEVRYSSGCAGSVSIGTAYTNGVTIPTGWYNFIYAPHRSGGSNGSADGDNTAYGNLLLFGMNNTNGRFVIRISSSSIYEVAQYLDVDGINKTDELWSYRKYSNGQVDAWYKGSINASVAFNTSQQSGKFYTNADWISKSIDLPSGLFKYAPIATANVSNNGYLISQVATVSTSAVVVRAFSLYSATYTVYEIMIHAHGVWK